MPASPPLANLLLQDYLDCLTSNLLRSHWQCLTPKSSLRPAKISSSSAQLGCKSLLTCSWLRKSWLLMRRFRSHEAFALVFHTVLKYHYLATADNVMFLVSDAGSISTLLLPAEVCQVLRTRVQHKDQPFFLVLFEELVPSLSAIFQQMEYQAHPAGLRVFLLHRSRPCVAEQLHALQLCAWQALWLEMKLPCLRPLPTQPRDMPQVHLTDHIHSDADSWTSEGLPSEPLIRRCETAATLLQYRASFDVNMYKDLELRSNNTISFSSL